MQHYTSQAFTDLGRPAGGAIVTVKIAGTNTTAIVYSDDGVTAKNNPFTTNNLGQLDFYAASGKYDITVTGTQITTYTLANQVLFDPFEQNAADTTMLVKALTTNGTVSAGNFSGPLSGAVTGNVTGNLISTTPNPASTGIVKLASLDAINFRNNANSADVNGISKNSSDVVVLGGSAGVQINGPITSINGITANGTLGIPVCVATVSQTGLTANVPTTNILASAPAGTYLATFYIYTTTAGTGGNVVLNVNWTAVTGGVTTGANSGGADLTAIGGLVSFQIISVPFVSAANQAITYSTQMNFVAGSPVYAVVGTLYRLA